MLGGVGSCARRPASVHPEVPPPLGRIVSFGFSALDQDGRWEMGLPYDEVVLLLCDICHHGLEPKLVGL
jgi:hypothetical protein